MPDPKRNIEYHIWNPEGETNSSNKGGSQQTTPAQSQISSSDFIKGNESRNQRLQKLNLQRDEGESSPQPMSFLEGLEKLPVSRGIINPMEQELNSDDNANPAVKVLSAIFGGTMGAVSTPFSEGGELIKGALKNVNYKDPAVGKQVNLGEEIVSGVNKAMNLPFEAVNKGSELTDKFFNMMGIKLPTIGSPETDKKLGSIAREGITLYLMGKGHEAIKNHLESKYPEIKNIPKEEVPNENQNQETDSISPLKRDSSVEPTADQAKEGTTQGNGEGLNQEKAPQTLKWIEPEKEFNKPLYKNVLTEYSKGYPLNSPELEGYRNENLPTAEVFKKLDDLGLTDQVKETQKRLNTLPTNDPQSISEDFEKIARITLREAEKKQTPDIGTNSRETDRETQNSGTLEGEVDSPISEEPRGELTPKTTGLKNDITDLERESRGTEKIGKPEVKNIDAAFEKAKASVDSGEVSPMGIVDEINKKPRVISDDENLQVTYYKKKLQNAYDSISKKMFDATDKGEDTAQHKVRLAQIEDELNSIDTAAKKAGTEWGRAGRFRQEEIKDDYSLAAVKTKARVANEGKPLDEVTGKRFDELSRRLEETNNKLKEQDDKIAKLEAEKWRQKTVRDTALQNRKAGRARTKEELISEREKLQKSIYVKLAGQANALIPLDVIPDVARLGRNYLESGINTVEGIVDQVYNDLKDRIDGIDKRDIRDAISGYGLEARKTIDDLTKQMNDLKRQMTIISKIEDIQGSNDPFKKTINKGKPSPELEALKKEYKEIADKEKFNKKDIAQYNDDPAGNVNRIKRLEQQLKDLIEGKEKITEPKQKREQSEREIGLRDQIDRLKKLDRTNKKDIDIYDDNPDWNNLKRQKERIGKQIKELERKLSDKDFSKKEKKPTLTDPEKEKLIGVRERLKSLIDGEIRKIQRANRSKLEKGLDWSKSWYRNILLSGTNTIGKLTSYALQKTIILKPIDAMESSLFNKIMPGIAEKASIEGGTLSENAKALSKNYVNFVKQYFDGEDNRQILKTGHGKLDEMYGRQGMFNTPEASAFFGHLHGILKQPTKRASFYYALEKQANWYMKNGYDLSDPTVQGTMNTAAYEYAMRDILLNDNAIVSAYKAATASLSRSGTGGKIASTAAQIALPIVKVPTNYVMDTAGYLGGGVKAGTMIFKAIKGGLENLKPEDANTIMRLAKKQTMGLGLLAVGYFNADSFGGYYQRGEKRKLNELKPGQMKLFGVELPTWASHNPAFEVMQFGATLRHLTDKRNGKSGDDVGTAILKTSQSLSSEIPFFNDQIIPSYGVTKMAADKVRSVIPPDIQKLARSEDMNRQSNHKGADYFFTGRGEVQKRYPKGFKEEIELGIPGLRKNVSQYKSTGGRP
jgi:hypothetical protein